MFANQTDHVTAPDSALPARAPAPLPIVIAIGLSVAGTLLFGTVIPATQALTVRTSGSTSIESNMLMPSEPEDSTDDYEEELPADMPADEQSPTDTVPAVSAR